MRTSPPHSSGDLTLIGVGPLWCLLRAATASGLTVSFLLLLCLSCRLLSTPLKLLLASRSLLSSGFCAATFGVKVNLTFAFLSLCSSERYGSVGGCGERIILKASGCILFTDPFDLKLPSVAMNISRFDSILFNDAFDTVGGSGWLER